MMISITCCVNDLLILLILESEVVIARVMTFPSFVCWLHGISWLSASQCSFKKKKKKKKKASVK